jgi:hypothetical protein
VGRAKKRRERKREAAEQRKVAFEQKAAAKAQRCNERAIAGIKEIIYDLEES